MAPETVTFQCGVNGRDFRDYAVFDTFRRRKRWHAPALFAGILTPFALLCFLMNQRQGAVLLGVVLLVVGWGLPLFYVGSFLLTLRRQTGKLPVKSFTVRMDREGVSMRRDKREEHWKWEDIQFAWRLPRLICIYPTPQQAFLLAREGGEKDLEAAWAFLQTVLPGDKLFHT